MSTCNHLRLYSALENTDFCEQCARLEQQTFHVDVKSVVNCDEVLGAENGVC